MKIQLRLTKFILLNLFPVFISLNGILAEPNEIKVGGILILSGEGSSIGIEAQHGALIAIDEVNSTDELKGKKLRFIWEDETSGKAERAVTAYRKLTSVDHVHYIFGPSFQDGLMALAPMAKRDNILLITPSTPSLGLPNVFSTWVDSNYDTDIFARWIKKKHQRVAVLAAQQSWELMVADKFKETFTREGGVITSYDAPLTDTTNVGPQILKVKSGNPEAVFVASYLLFPRYVRELRNQGINIPIYTVEADNSSVEASLPESNGTISIGPSIPPSSFGEKYEKRFGRKPDVPAHQAYDAIMLLVKALQSGGDEVKSVKNYFDTFSSYNGVSGLIARKNGVASTSLALFQVINGRLEKIEELKDGGL